MLLKKFIISYSKLEVNYIWFLSLHLPWAIARYTSEYSSRYAESDYKYACIYHRLLCWVNEVIRGWLKLQLPQTHWEGDQDQEGDQLEGWHGIKRKIIHEKKMVLKYSPTPTSTLEYSTILIVYNNILRGKRISKPNFCNLHAVGVIFEDQIIRTLNHLLIAFWKNLIS